MTVDSHAISTSGRVYASGMDDLATSRSAAAVAYLGDLISPYGGSPLQISDRSEATGSDSTTAYRVTDADQRTIIANALLGAARTAVDSDGHLRDKNVTLIASAMQAIVDGFTSGITDATPNAETSQALLRLRESLMWLQAASK